MPRLLLLILALALILRLGAVAGTWHAQPWGDPADYHVHGSALALAGSYPATTFAEPGGASAFGLRCFRISWAPRTSWRAYG